MTRSIATITINGRRRRSFKGTKHLAGRIVFSANSQFATSNIEKHFRICEHINVNLFKGGTVQWTRSATKNRGGLDIYAGTSGLTSTWGAGTSAVTTSTLLAVSLGITSGTFTATGM